jgi:hypothetical protein
MRSAPDIVKVMQVYAAPPSFAVMIITRMVSVVIGKLRLPGMANDDATSVVDDQRISTNSIQCPDASRPARQEYKTRVPRVGVSIFLRIGNLLRPAISQKLPVASIVDHIR